MEHAPDVAAGSGSGSWTASIALERGQSPHLQRWFRDLAQIVAL